MVPFWTSQLLRNYAWIMILGAGAFRRWLASVGLERLRLINTPVAVLIGTVYGYLPLMVPADLCQPREARPAPARGLGRSRRQPVATFLQVTLPLSLPGVATGSMLVFILLMGEFLSRRCSAAARCSSSAMPGRSVPAVAQLAIRRGGGDGTGRHHVRDGRRSIMRFVLGAAGGARRGGGLSRCAVYACARLSVFLYAPIALIVLFSFNAGRYAMDLQGFSIEWYGKAFANPFMVEALRTSLIVGCHLGLLATIFGTLAALGWSASAAGSGSCSTR